MTAFRYSRPPQWALWLLVVLALVLVFARAHAEPVYACYDEGQWTQVETIGKTRLSRKLSPVFALINPNDGPGSGNTRATWLAWKPAGVERIGYVDLERDEQLRSIADIRADVLVWRQAYKVQWLFLDDCRSWDISWRAKQYADAVWAAIKDSGFDCAHVILNPGAPVTKTSNWMREKPYLLVEFEDPLGRLKPQAAGAMWFGFVPDAAAGRVLINTAKARKVRWWGCDDLKNWKVVGKEYQTQLPADLFNLYLTTP